MAIGDSKLHKMIARRRLLDEAVVWYNSFDDPLKTKILDWIRQDQLFKKGIDADGEIIGRYSFATSLINPQKAFNTPFTLYDKGDFFRSMFVEVLRESLIIDATSSSFKEMQTQEWFTNKILDLTNENLEKLKKEVQSKYVEAVKSALYVD